ncbi:Uncharacterized protein FKW44_018334, partial [Caligus rogercresseyi]
NKSFEQAKSLLTTVSDLSHPIHNAPTSIATDASADGIGAVLQQNDGVSWKPLAFFSKGLNPAERKRSAYDRELLAIFRAIRHFQHFVEGRNFHVLTDH